MSDFDTQYNNLTISKRIDEICDRFEDAWNSKSPERIESVLKTVPDPERNLLLRELLELELDLRHITTSDEKAYEEYHARFSDDFQIVDSVFGKKPVLKELGDYELLEELGHGGMGVVYKARQRYLNQIVAIKVLSSQFLNEPQAVARFRREMQLIGGLSHPNIVRAYNAGEENGVHYLVMEFVEGVDVHVLLKRNEQDSSISLNFPLGAACEVIRQAACGLQHAYENGLIHRDIKPGNLMITRDGTVKILDLGLGKFQGESRPNDADASLTQVGSVMGTIDYMAPEQWDDAGKVDIRADIYSLGCSFYYLLAAKPPFSDDLYDSTRKKLMAHIVGPIPLLSDEFPGIPSKLEKVFEKMMAKEPAERFQTPNELIEAIEPFADEDKFFGFLEHAFETLEKHGVIETDEKSGGLRRSVSRNTRRRKKSIWDNFEPESLKKKWPFILGGLLFLLLCALMIGKFRSGSSGSDTTQIVSKEELETIRTDLTQLPGMNGMWWFYEIPWYLPFAREAVAEKLSDPKNAQRLLVNNPYGYLAPNNLNVQKWLRDVLHSSEDSLTPRQQRLISDLQKFTDARLTREERTKNLREYYDRFNTSLGKGEKDTASDLHTKALLLSMLSGLADDSKLQDQAFTFYQQALKAYESENSSQLLRLLCEADALRLLYRKNQDFAEFQQRAKQILNVKESSRLFRAELMITLGATASGAGEYQDRAFIDARTELEKANLEPLHPLEAHLCERYAWSLLDQWKIKEAREQFKRALDIRTANYLSSKDTFASIYVFHNKHGMAMTARYMGDTEQAKSEYSAVLTDIEKAMHDISLRKNEPGMQQYYSNLRERFSNTQERLADCYLYAGAASGMYDTDLETASKLCEESQNNIESTAVKIVMGCKKAILESLRGSTKEAKDILEEFKDSEDKLLGNKKRVILIKELAEATLALKTEATAKEGADRLRDFLDRFRLYPNDPESVRRETLEMRLLAIEILLNDSLKKESFSIARSDLVQLDALFSGLNNRAEMSPFLRRYYELGIRTCRADYDPTREGNRQLLKIAGYIRRMRTENSNEMPIAVRPTMILFYLSNNPNDSFAIVLPQDGRQGTLIPIPLTRFRVKSLAKSRTSTEMPKALLERIREEESGGHPIEISWSDENAWPDKQNSLNISEWPFKNDWQPPK